MSVFSDKKNITFRSNDEVSDLQIYPLRERDKFLKVPGGNPREHGLLNKRSALTKLDSIF